MQLVEGMVVSSTVTASHSSEQHEITATIVHINGKYVWLLDEKGFIYIVKDYELYIKE